VDLYTMTPNFLPDRPLDNFVSSIWTERFFTAGEVQIVVPAVPEMVEMLGGGTLLGLRGSREVMILHTHETKDGLLTVTGDTLVKFLDERMAWFRDPEDWSLTAEYSLTDDAGTVLTNVLDQTVINPVAWTGSGAAINLDWARDKIDNLELGEMDLSGDAWPRTFPIGPLYSGLESFVKREGMGFRIYLDSADESGYVLKFMAYRGRDRTSGQDVNPLIRLSPHMDSITDLKEVLSISEYKNVVYLHYNDEVDIYYAEPTLAIPEGFDRRVMVVEPSGGPPSFGETAEWKLQKAKDAFANNNYIRAIDGQASLLAPYRYQRDYRLGDIIELEGITGALAKARVTEYIRVHDSLGHREYPTISVVDPLETGNWPALNTDPDDPLQWDTDPGYDIDFGVGEVESDPDDYPGNPYGETPTGSPPVNPYPDPDPDYDPETDPDPDPPDPDEDPDPDPPPEIDWNFSYAIGMNIQYEGSGIYTDYTQEDNETALEGPHALPGGEFDVHLDMDIQVNDIWVGVPPAEFSTVEITDFADLTGAIIRIELGTFDKTYHIEDSRAYRQFNWMDEDGNHYPMTTDPADYPDRTFRLVMMWRLLLTDGAPQDGNWRIDTDLDPDIIGTDPGIVTWGYHGEGGPGNGWHINGPSATEPNFGAVIGSVFGNRRYQLP
jgi:hypothetical protein